jgi:hypothetical protein
VDHYSVKNTFSETKQLKYSCRESVCAQEYVLSVMHQENKLNAKPHAAARRLQFSICSRSSSHTKGNCAR